MRVKRSAFFATILFSMYLLGGCNRWVNPYNPESAEKKLQKCRTDITTVNKYIIESGYSFIYIESADGHAYADFEEVKIEDTLVKKSIKNLLTVHDFLEINMNNNTIEYMLWKGFHGRACGIVYSINNNDLPEIQYDIELVPLADTGWYYYAEDYNEWRVRSTEQDIEY